MPRGIGYGRRKRFGGRRRSFGSFRGRKRRFGRRGMRLRIGNRM